MATDKQKHAFWLTDEAKTMVEIDFQLDNCGSQSEFVEKAICCYVERRAKNIGLIEAKEE